MIQNDELSIGFTMEFAQHSDILNRFSKLPEPEKQSIIEKARDVRTRNAFDI